MQERFVVKKEEEEEEEKKLKLKLKLTEKKIKGGLCVVRRLTKQSANTCGVDTQVSLSLTSITHTPSLSLFDAFAVSTSTSSISPLLLLYRLKKS